MNRNRLCAIILVALLLFYWTISLQNLTIVPRVYEDEPWQASSGWKITTEGVFGTDLFTGYHGMENRYYGYMPLHPLALAAIFKFVGLGLFQARLETVALGLLTLALTYSLAARLFKDARIGLLSILFLMFVRTTGTTPSQVSGILFLDMARIARYDMMVPVLGLASLHVYISARDAVGSRAWLYIVAGLLAGLCGLAHVYGVFGLPVLLLLALWDNSSEVSSARWNVVAYLLLGFMLPWLLYAVYVLGDLEAWRGQTAGYADRFDLLNPAWYAQNVLQEYRRYNAGLGPFGATWFLRIGFWSALIAIPLSITVLLRHGLQGDRSARVIVVPALVIAILFAILIRLKLSNYLVALASIWAIAVAWGAVILWHRLKPIRWALLGLAAILALVMFEGASRILVLQSAAETTSPYDTYIARVRSHLPPDAHVLGLHNYWFGLDAFDYRSFALPILWGDPRTEQNPMTFEQGLDQIAPDIVLVDARIREYFLENMRGAGDDEARFLAWLDRNEGDLIARVEDTTYGLMEIYQVHPER